MKWWRERPALSRVSSLKCLKCKQEQVKYKAKLSYIPIIHNSVNHFSSSPSHSPPLPSTPPHPTPPHSTPLHSTLLYSTQPHSTSSFHFTSLQLLTLNPLHSTPLHSPYQPTSLHIIPLHLSLPHFVKKKWMFPWYLRKIMKSAMDSTINSGTNRSPAGVYWKRWRATLQ